MSRDMEDHNKQRASRCHLAQPVGTLHVLPRLQSKETFGDQTDFDSLHHFLFFAACGGAGMPTIDV